MLLALLAAVSLSAVPPSEPAWSTLVVDLSEQRVYVLDPHGSVLRTMKASTGASATPTPTGRFKVHSKSRRTFVRDNPSVTMTHMVRFRGGVGFHAIPRDRGTPLPTPLGIRPVSHGCVRLSDGDAREVFTNVEIGTEVIVRK